MASAGPLHLVMLYDADGDVCEEMLHSTFQALLAGEGRLERHAASVTKAVYIVVGNSLAIRGVVYFQFAVDEDGRVDPAFNLPLQYLVQQAGLGEDIGQGPIRKASRGQCPVPWHAVNLWEPSAEQTVDTLQKIIFRNKLKIDNLSDYRDEDFFSSPADAIDLVDIMLLEEDDEMPTEQETASAAPSRAQTEPQNQAEKPRPKRAEQDVTRSTHNGASQNPGPSPLAAKNQEFTAKLTEVFGEAGKLSLQDLIRLHTDQLNQAKAKYREDIETQQMSYLDQLRACRDEIHSLKVALRQEQGRNRRLQQMLRGDL